MLNFPNVLSLIALGTAVLALPFSAAAHNTARAIVFPDIPGYLTLKCDFHQHTVFSDGQVWPTIRVEEAVRDGLDAIAITDHFEYQPHESDIPHPDRNRSAAIAAAAAVKKNALVVHGAEVTRSMPPGHVNGIFLQDANALRRDDPVEALREASRQGAFLFWNHPFWTGQTPDGIARVTPMHEQLFTEGLLHGIEVANTKGYSDEALQLALDRNLTIIGNSDIHSLIEWDYPSAEGEHRPITLVFSKERTEAALKEALFARRTVAWFKNTLIGRAEWMNPLLSASLTAAADGYRRKSTVLDISITNHTTTDFLLRNTSSYRFYDSADTLLVKAHQTLSLAVKTIEHLQRVTISFEVMNAVTAPGKHPTLTLPIEITQRE